MNRKAEKRAERQIQTLFRTDGDHCTLCRRRLEHNDNTYAGVLPDERPALTGECCRGRLAHTLFGGLYVTRYQETLPQRAKKGTTRGYTADEVSVAVGSLQHHFGTMDAVGRDLARRAGLTTPPAAINFVDSPWKADDAAWFEANPGRSHRLRSPFGGEIASLKLGPLGTEQPPPTTLVLVRQIAPGSRARTLVVPDQGRPVPDVEELLHALFDLVTAKPARLVPAHEITALAQRYIATAKARTMS